MLVVLGVFLAALIAGPGLWAQSVGISTLMPGRDCLIENLGQWDEAVLFAFRGNGRAVWVTREGLVLQGESRDGDGKAAGMVLRLQLVGASDAMLIRGVEAVPGSFHFIIGNDRARWVSHATGYRAVEFGDAWPGIDVRVGIDASGPRLDFQMSPGADPGDVRLEYEGATGLVPTATGRLRVETDRWSVGFMGPTGFAVDAAGVETPVECRSSIDTDGTWLICEPTSTQAVLTVVSQGLDWSTFLGGSETDYIWDVALGSNEEPVIVGFTWSPDFHATAGAYDASLSGFTDLMVARLRSDATSLVYATYLGGSGSDGSIGGCVAVAADETPVIGSKSDSVDFPVTPGAYATEKAGPISGSGDCVVVRLSADGSQLLYGTYLGGAETGLELPAAIAVDPDGVITVAGEVAVRDFPTTAGAFQESDPDDIPQVYDGFVTRFTRDGSGLQFSTYLGGSGHDYVRDMLVDESGDVIVTGETVFADDFPTTPGALMSAGSGDAFVTRMSADGSSLVWSTGLGGGGPLGSTNGRSIMRDRAENVVIVGETNDPDFPATPDAFDGLLNFAGGGYPVHDLFVAKLDPTGSTLLYATFLGGAHHEALSVAGTIDSSGAVTVAAHCQSTDFPTTPGAFSNFKNGLAADLVVARLHPSGHSLIYGTYFGGTEQDTVATQAPLVLDEMGAVIVGSSTHSPDLPLTPGALDTTYGGSEPFLAKFSMLPTGVSRFGASTPSCGELSAIGAYLMPQLGSSAFVLTCTNAPVRGTGWLVVGLGALGEPVPAVGADLWLDPTSLIGAVPVQADDVGWTEQRVGIPDDTALLDVEVYVQYVWQDPCSPPLLAASNALAITIQP